jgi:redox-sensitive bicupin YhaK (pirin superfamily)
MEIITWVLSGALEHRDSLGNGSIIRPGDAQRMTAGTGIMHSEFNPSPDEPVRLLQIWILPDRQGLRPGYEQHNFTEADRRGRLCQIVSPDGAEGAITIHQDARVRVQA